MSHENNQNNENNQDIIKNFLGLKGEQKTKQQVNENIIQKEFLMACRKGSIDIVKLFFESSQSIHYNTIQTGFQYACEYACINANINANIEIAKLLLTLKRDQEVSCFTISELFLYICGNRNKELAEWLLLGLNDHRKISGDVQHKAFMLACKTNQYDIAKMLLKLNDGQNIIKRDVKYDALKYARKQKDLDKIVELLTDHLQ